MSDNTQAELELKAVEKSSELFKSLLIAEGTNFGSLWKAWHYLQIYSIWGLHLPNTEDDLKMLLDIKDPAAYPFYVPMLTSYQQINTASIDFTKNIFPEVVSVGKGILAFGMEAATDEDGFFSAIITMINEKSPKDDVRDLIVDLRNTAQSNAKKANEVAKKLKKYGDALIEAKVSVDKANEIIIDENKKNNIDISELEGGKDVLGSVANLKDAMDLEKADYEHYKIVAATTAIYGWVPFVGIIMMGVYADKAVKSLKEYHRKKAALENATDDLKRATNIKKVQDLAKTGISSAKEYTDFAILQINTVSTAWTGVSENLNMILEKLSKMTTKINNNEKIRAKSQVKSLARACGDYWNDLMPAIRQLTDNPYINNIEEISLEDAMTEIDKAIANSKNQN